MQPCRQVTTGIALDIAGRGRIADKAGDENRSPALHQVGTKTGRRGLPILDWSKSETVTDAVGRHHFRQSRDADLSLQVAKPLLSHIRDQLHRRLQQVAFGDDAEQLPAGDHQQASGIVVENFPEGVTKARHRSSRWWPR